MRRSIPEKSLIAAALLSVSGSTAQQVSVAAQSSRNTRASSRKSENSERNRNSCVNSDKRSTKSCLNSSAKEKLLQISPKSQKIPNLQEKSIAEIMADAEIVPADRLRALADKKNREKEARRKKKLQEQGVIDEEPIRLALPWRVYDRQLKVKGKPVIFKTADHNTEVPIDTPYDPDAESDNNSSKITAQDVEEEFVPDLHGQIEEAEDFYPEEKNVDTHSKNQSTTTSTVKKPAPKETNTLEFTGRRNLAEQQDGDTGATIWDAATILADFMGNEI